MGSDSIRKISLEDVPAFMKLQDEFVLEHHALTQKLYDKVTLSDWQHCLICPEKIMLEPGGREKQLVGMVKQEDKVFRNIHVLMVDDGPTQVGYIMLHVQKSQRRRPEAYVQVKQLYVRSTHRQRGLGTLLLDGMRKVSGPEADDLRLSVLDSNTSAFNWYRSRGFVLTGVVWEYLGHQEDAHLVAYKVMQRLTKSESVKSDKAILFRSEVIGEVVGIQYPDGSGPFDVTIRGWIESEQLHMVDSKSLSTWNGERFTDLIDFNEAFTSGRAAFHRKLSLVMRDVEMTKMLAKKAKEKGSDPDERRKRKKQEHPLHRTLRKHRQVQS
ncbi:unnamed protein product [Durusdinium trenchii]|uniref:N-acetyltransferase domain-containing protein n=2 Tax=Durusdinium trenchii TaxID=1381693 RepID=A0ABP0HL57_9DINO